MITSIKVLGREIKVEYCSQTRLSLLADDADALGFFDGETIFIKQSLSEKPKKRILMHEKIHAILAISGLSNMLDSDMEEAICDAMETLAE